MDIKKEVGKRLKTIRIQQGKTLEDFGQILEISPYTISRYERGMRTPDIEFIYKFGRKFNINANWLLYGDLPILKGSESVGVQRAIESKNMFLELAGLLQKKSIPAIDTAASNETIKSNHPDNFLRLLHFMLIDDETRQNVLTYFYLIELPRYAKARIPGHPANGAGHGS